MQGLRREGEGEREQEREKERERERQRESRLKLPRERERECVWTERRMQKTRGAAADTRSRETQTTIT
eukprot:3757186-Rhodomonas_salina.2